MCSCVLDAPAPADAPGQREVQSGGWARDCDWWDGSAGKQRVDQRLTPPPGFVLLGAFPTWVCLSISLVSHSPFHCLESYYLSRASCLQVGVAFCAARLACLAPFSIFSVMAIRIKTLHARTVTWNHLQSGMFSCSSLVYIHGKYGLQGRNEIGVYCWNQLWGLSERLRQHGGRNGKVSLGSCVPKGSNDVG